MRNLADTMNNLADKTSLRTSPMRPLAQSRTPTRCLRRWFRSSSEKRSSCIVARRVSAPWFVPLSLHCHTPAAIIYIFIYLIYRDAYQMIKLLQPLALIWSNSLTVDGMDPCVAVPSASMLLTLPETCKWIFVLHDEWFQLTLWIQHDRGQIDG